MGKDKYRNWTVGRRLDCKDVNRMFYILISDTQVGELSIVAEPS